MPEPNQPNPENQPPPAPPPVTGVTANPLAATPATPSTGVTAGAPPRPAVPPPPPRPAAPAAKGPTRRFFLASLVGSWFSVAWVALAASVTGLTLGTVRFLFPNVLSEPPSTFRAGS